MELVLRYDSMVVGEKIFKFSVFLYVFYMYIKDNTALKMHR